MNSPLAHTARWARSVAPMAILFLLPGPAVAADAIVNLEADPFGRVVDLTFDESLTLEAPWDRYRFDLDTVQPLARDGASAFGDLTGDGVADLVLVTFDGVHLFFPGIAGEPRRFGRGVYLRHETDSPEDDPYYDLGTSAVWGSAAIADLDGDGHNDVVLGTHVHVNVGNAGDPVLRHAQSLLGESPWAWDPSVATGDLDDDGDPDVILELGYTGRLSVFWNNSSPGSFVFSEEHLFDFDDYYDNRLVVGDLNGDGRLDLAGAAGIYFNQGSAEQPSFDFSAPAPWSISGGPDLWLSSSDMGTALALHDGDGDGLLDVYVSRLAGATVMTDLMWEVVYYRNTGTAAAPAMTYAGPIVVDATPLNVYYRGEDVRSISGKRAFVAAADLDENGRSELLVSTSKGDFFGSPGIVWSWPGASGLSYPDLSTYPEHQHINSDCGGDWWVGGDALCEPPNLLSAWLDVSGDGLPDAIRTDQFMDAYGLSTLRRSGVWPFALEAEEPLLAASADQATAMGVALIDVDGDGVTDLVGGSEDGQLVYYRNTASLGTLELAEPVVLSDAGAPIDVGDQSWPTPFDLDGDGDLDILVADYEGRIHRVMCDTPGRADGYSAGGLLGTAEQDPLDFTHVFGGGTIAPSLATLDVDGDGLDDVVAGDVSGMVWLLRNTGSETTPVFTFEPLVVDSTAAAYVEALGSDGVRLSFALPVEAWKSVISYHGVAASSGVVSGSVTVGGGAGATCTPSATTLCLLDNRFAVTVDWHDQHNDRHGVGTAVPFADRTGFFWFFNQANIELVVKILDGTSTNGSYWVFYGGLSDVEYRIHVTDTETGSTRTYHNEPGNICGDADTGAFQPKVHRASRNTDFPPGGHQGTLRSSHPEAGLGWAATASTSDHSPMSRTVPVGEQSSDACVPDEQTLCLLDNRFAVTVDWHDHRADRDGSGTAIPQTNRTGLFWFFNQSNIELLVKVLDGTPVNGCHWVFYGALSDVEYWIRVTDTATGSTRTYHNEPGNICGGADTTAF